MKYNQSILAGLFCLLSFNTIAKVDDLQQEVKIAAASQEADIKNNQVIFFGPVEVTQGSIKPTSCVYSRKKIKAVKH